MVGNTKAHMPDHWKARIRAIAERFTLPSSEATNRLSDAIESLLDDCCTEACLQMMTELGVTEDQAESARLRLRAELSDEEATQIEEEAREFAAKHGVKATF